MLSGIVRGVLALGFAESVLITVGYMLLGPHVVAPVCTTLARSLGL